MNLNLSEWSRRGLDSAEHKFWRNLNYVETRECELCVAGRLLGALLLDQGCSYTQTLRRWKPGWGSCAVGRLLESELPIQRHSGCDLPANLLMSRQKNHGSRSFKASRVTGQVVT